MTQDLLNKWNYKRKALPADLQAEWEVSKKKPRSDPKRQQFVVDVAGPAN